jgi:integrase
VPQPKFQLYKHIKISGKWRYCRAAIYSNGKVKPHVVVVGAQEEEHEEGSSCIRHKKSWIEAGAEPLAAQRMRSKLVDQTEYTTVQPLPFAKGTLLPEALDNYLSDLEALGRTDGTLATYRRDITPFVQNCKAVCVGDVARQGLIEYMRWQRKQPIPQRKHANPERTYHNRLINVRSFLNAFGVTKLFRRGEYRKRYHEKKVVAHPETELSVLYSHAGAEDWFLLDFFIGSMARDHEAYGCQYGDLTGTILTIRGKQHKTRTVEISQRLANSINRRRKTTKSELLLPQKSDPTKPDKHLLRRLQNIAKRAKATFHTELHKLRKTGASRRNLSGVSLPTLMQELGQESLATTQDYLDDVRKEEEIKKAVADSDYVPKPRLVSGTGGN